MATFNKIQDNGNGDNNDFDAKLFKEAINAVEASGDSDAYTLESATSNAVGPYQIIVRFASDEKKKLEDEYNLGKITKEVFDEKVSGLTDNVHAQQLQKKYGITSKEQFKNKPKVQENYMDWLITHEYPKQIKSLIRDYGPSGQNLTRNAIKDFSQEGLIGDLSYYDLMAIEHFQGHPSARNYFASLREGTDFFIPGTNKTIPEYLSSFRGVYSPSSQVEEGYTGVPFIQPDSTQQDTTRPILPKFIE